MLLYILIRVTGLHQIVLCCALHLCKASIGVYIEISEIKASTARILLSKLNIQWDDCVEQPSQGQATPAVSYQKLYQSLWQPSLIGQLFQILFFF